MKKWIVLLMAVLFSGMLFWSCSDDDNSTDPDPNTPADFSGDWSIIPLEAKAEAIKLNVVQDGANVSGTIADHSFTGTVTNSSIVISFTSESSSTTCTGSLSSNVISGTWVKTGSNAGNGTFTATKGWTTPINIDGDWTVISTSYDGNNHGQQHLIFDQWTNSTGFDGEVDGMLLKGDCTGGIINFTVDIGDGEISIATGTLSGDNISGTYINKYESNGVETDHGTWTGTRGWTPIPSGMIFVKGGTFQMGDEVADLYERCWPVHQVTLNSFYISATEVTQAEWKAVMGGWDSDPWGWVSTYGIGDNYPVYYITWYSMIKYCNLKSTTEVFDPVYTINNSTNPADWGGVPYYDYNNDVIVGNTALWDAVICDFSAKGYRLPTDAEFEYAARGGTHYTDDYYYSGSNDVNSVAWYDGNNDPPYGSKPVGTKAPNQLGLYDMSGNLWESCWDWWHTYTTDAQVNPTGPLTPTEGFDRVVRGGIWFGAAYDCRVANRWYGYPYNSGYPLGFRLARTP